MSGDPMFFFTFFQTSVFGAKLCQIFLISHQWKWVMRIVAFIFNHGSLGARIRLETFLNICDSPILLKNKSSAKLNFLQWINWMTSGREKFGENISKTNFRMEWEGLLKSCFGKCCFTSSSEKFFRCLLIKCTHSSSQKFLDTSHWIIK